MLVQSAQCMYQTVWPELHGVGVNAEVYTQC